MNMHSSYPNGWYLYWYPYGWYPVGILTAGILTAGIFTAGILTAGILTAGILIPKSDRLLGDSDNDNDRLPKWYDEGPFGIWKHPDGDEIINQEPGYILTQKNGEMLKFDNLHEAMTHNQQEQYEE